MRLRPRRRPSIPAETAALLELDPGERVLAWSPLAVAGFAAVTAAGVRVLTPHGKLIRRPWVEVDHLAWDHDSRTLAVWWVGSRQALGLELPEDSFVPEVSHERWRSSVVATREVPLPGGRPGWVALRRDDQGRLTTQVNLPRGVRPDDPQATRIMEKASARLREEVGLDTADGGPLPL
jgi:hypothetical protein